MQLKIFTPLMIFLLLALSVLYSYQIHSGRSIFLATDFGKFYQSARFFLTGKDIYTKIYVKKLPAENITGSTDNSGAKNVALIKQAASDLNPPFFTFIISPLGLLNYSIAYTFWCVFSILCGVLSAIFLQKAISVPFQHISYTLAIILALFVYYPTFSVIQFGQVSLVLLALLSGAWLAAKQKYLALAGILLGVAASLKIIFGLFLFYFLFRREWRGLFGFILTGIICTLIPLSLLGSKTYFNYYSVIRHIYWYASTWNASLLGFFLRLFGGPEKNVPLISAPWLTYKLYFLSSFLLLIGLIKYLQPTKKIEPTAKLDLDFSSVIVTMLLISPLGWLYYFSWLSIPFLACWKLINQRETSLWLGFMLAICILLSSIPHTLASSANIIQTNVFILFIFSSCYVLALLLLLNVLYILRFQSNSPKMTVTSGNNYSLIYLLALLVSLFGILHTVNDGALFGHHLVLTYGSPYFGT